MNQSHVGLGYDHFFDSHTPMYNFLTVFIKTNVICFSVCCLIEKLSEAKLKLHESPIIPMWQELIDECLQHAELEVQVLHINRFTAVTIWQYQA